ncbi:(Fe-S)-binding protein [Geobacter sp. SVR]|uniref:(Fe-S)-binding protein n=1 Tax=Geobacter sp. SVR TaxID=2495594 RepID=UPI00143EF98A|nr:(Fe-S)-binding protein [Geobacter sp. SVR]BCS54169.1 (Fe-S)-binding protein [Geobacter sp. SVR]GCF85972.1 (Fe-S)-binding protein [Geobacter sp. SVR]
MKELIREAVQRLIVENKGNWSDSLSERYFDEPLVNFASGDDPLFEDFKQIIGPWHRTPREAFEAAYGEGSWRGGTVISWVMPWSKGLRDSNRICKERPSLEWTQAYFLSSKMLQKQVRTSLLAELAEYGHRGVAPADADWFSIVDSPSGKSSTWSERHAGYVAGLGTFGLNDAFISEKGMAVVLNSVVIDAVLPSDSRAAASHQANCLFYATGGCGACIARCPVNAISRSTGHDKNICMMFGYGPESNQLAAERGVQGPAGCALCQVGVPCESRNPSHSLKQHTTP